MRMNNQRQKVAKKAKENNLDLKTSLQEVGTYFLSSREVIAQECACHSCG